MMGEWGWGFGGGFMILWWLLVIVSIAALVKWMASSSSGKGARDVLDERYARGEIDREEYEKRRRDLAR